MVGLLGWVSRHRVTVMVVAMVTATVSHLVLRTTDIAYAWLLILLAGLLLPFGLLLLAIAGTRSYHPAALVARPEVPALDVPADPGTVLAAAGYTFFAASVLDGSIRDLAAGTDRWSSAVLGFFTAAVLAAFWWSAVGRFGIRLTPDGITDRQLIGSVFVPWDALAVPGAAYPRQNRQITLRLAVPARVRRRGLRNRAATPLPATGVDAELLARAIHEYTNRPGLRPAIGTPAELARLLAIPRIAGFGSGPE